MSKKQSMILLGELIFMIIIFVIGIFIGGCSSDKIETSNCHIVTSCTPEIKYLYKECNCTCQEPTDCIKELYQAKELLNRTKEMVK